MQNGGPELSRVISAFVSDDIDAKNYNLRQMGDASDAGVMQVSHT